MPSKECPNEVPANIQAMAKDVLQVSIRSIPADGVHDVSILLPCMSVNGPDTVTLVATSNCPV
jgi:hypothetical protein